MTKTKTVVNVCPKRNKIVARRNTLKNKTHALIDVNLFKQKQNFAVKENKEVHFL